MNPAPDPLAGLDRIEVRDVRAWGRHGVLPAEQELGQVFAVDVDLLLSTAAAGRTDRLDLTVSYAAAVRAVHEEITGGPHALVETLAERIAERLLAGPGRPLLRRVAVTVHKPAAPVGLPVGDVRVRVVRDAPPVAAVLALGSNLGDREARLREALAALRDAPGVDVDRASPVVETAPVGGPAGQGPFLNAVVLLRTVLPPDHLLALAHRLEDAAGRTRTEHWGPRPLDVDVVTYGELRSADPVLALPHPRAAGRAFVLDPWWRADPEARLPGHGAVAELRERAADRGDVRPGPAVDGFGSP